MKELARARVPKAVQHYILVTPVITPVPNHIALFLSLRQHRCHEEERTAALNEKLIYVGDDNKLMIDIHNKIWST